MNPAEFLAAAQAEVAKHDARVPEQRAGERFHCELDAHIAESMKDPEFAAAYDDATERHRIIDELLALRRERGITQKAVAERMGVGQPTMVCDHAPEVSAKRLAEAAAPETEGPAQTLLTAGAVPFADETGHGFEIDLTSAQPAAEGAREDDGLDREELEHTIFGAMEALGIEDAAMSDARMIADAVEGLLSDWSGSSRP